MRANNHETDYSAYLGNKD